MTNRSGISRRGLMAGAMGVTAAGLLLPRALLAQTTPQKGGSFRIGQSGAPLRTRSTRRLLPQVPP